MGPRLPVYPVAGLGSSCLPVASHTDSQMWMALSSSQVGAPGPLLANFQSPLFPMVTWITPTAKPTLASWASPTCWLVWLDVHSWSHKCSLSVSPGTAILMHQPWCPMVFPQLLHLDFCLLTGPRRREPLTHEKSWKWSLMRRWDRLCWSGAGCGQTSVWTKCQFLDAFLWSHLCH